MTVVGSEGPCNVLSSDWWTNYFVVDVVVQFYAWFKFYFPLFQTHYHTLPYPETKGNTI